MRTLIEQAAVVSMDPRIGTLPAGDVLIDGDTIVDVARRLDVEDCERIDGRGCILTPGFVDSHRHLWQTSLRGLCANMSTMEYMWGVRLHVAHVFTPEDLYIATHVGALECLNAGVTTVAGYEHNVATSEDAYAGITALRDAGVRSVYGMGLLVPRSRPTSFAGLADQTTLLRRLQDEFCSGSALLSLGVCPGEFMVAGTDAALEQYRVARELGLLVTHHAAVVAGSGAEIDVLHDAGLLSDAVVIVHGNGCDERQCGLLLDAGATISVQAEVEVGMAIGPPSLVCQRRAGLAPTLGIDTVATNSGDMFAQMRLAFETVCLAEAQEVIDEGLNPIRLTVTTDEALRWGTINGARALNMDDAIGSIAVGKQADLVLLRADGLPLAGWYEEDPGASVVTQASVADVDTVFVAGRCVKRDGRMLVDPRPAIERLTESKARILRDTPRTAGLSGFRSVIPDPPPELPLVPLAER